MSPLALDTSAAVPLLLRRHPAHAGVRDAIADSTVAFTGHSLAETYSVLTRLPGDARLDATDAARLLSSNFERPLLLASETARELPAILSSHGISGGAVYDAIVGLCLAGTEATLLTRDRRAAATYAALGVTFRLL